MIIAFGTKEAHDKLMEGLQKLEYRASEITQLKEIAGADEVVLAYEDDRGQTMLEPTQITLDEWIDRFGGTDCLHDGTWAENL